MKTHTQIQKWGNSLAIRLTGAIKEIAHLKEGMEMEIEATEMYIKLYPKKVLNQKIKLPYTESELLKGITAYNAHADLVNELIDKEFEN